MWCYVMSNIYTCGACKYTTNRLWNYNKHIQTIKHMATIELECKNSHEKKKDNIGFVIGHQKFQPSSFHFIVNWRPSAK